MIMWAGSTTGPRASPGKYTREADGGWQDADPELRGEEGPAPGNHAEDYAKQLSLSLQVRDKLSDDQ